MTLSSPTPALFFVALSVVLVVLFRGASAVDCGTCDTLNYQCITPANPLALKDNCGQVLDPALCPVLSCPDYCATTAGSAVGACNDATHQCDCTTSTFSSSSSSPSPTPTPSGGCTALTCATLQQALKCIPTGTKDACTGQVIPEDACGFSVCPDDCPCSAGGTGCVCATSVQPTPTGPKVKAQNVSYPTFTAANGTMFLGGGAIAGITIGSALTVAALIFIGIALANQCSGAREESDAGRLVKRTPGFYGKKAGGVPLSY